MCFDTKASNTGRLNGTCKLLEIAINRNLLWMACRHHMFEVLLSDAFGVCLGLSKGPDILLFKRFKDKCSKLVHHQPVPRLVPLISACDKLKEFIAEQLQLGHPRDYYREFLQLAASMIRIKRSAVPLRQPGGLHRARWMAKAIYAMKIELLLDGNEVVIELAARELQGIKRFNRFVVTIYIQSWFSCRIVADASLNDIMLIQSLHDCDDAALQSVGLKMMKRHSWYISPELATVALVSHHLSDEDKTQLVLNMKGDRGLHLIKTLPRTVSELLISRSFFQTMGIDSSFLYIPTQEWHDSSHTRLRAS